VKVPGQKDRTKLVFSMALNYIRNSWIVIYISPLSYFSWRLCFINEKYYLAVFSFLCSMKFKVN